MQKKKIWENSQYVMMVIPAIVFFILFFAIPLFLTAKSSFYYWRSYSPVMEFVGLENYAALFQDNLVLGAIKNTLVYAVACVSLQSVIALPVAAVLNTKFPGRNIFRAVFFCPTVLSTLVVGYLWKYLLSSSDYGFVNQVLRGLGFETVNFLGSSKYALAMIIMTQVWQWLGYAMVLYLGNMQSISGELYEAASIDGANAMHSFWHITIPGCAPAIKVNLITGAIRALQVFDIILAMTMGGPAHKTETILTLMFQNFTNGDYGYASSFGILFLLVTMALTVVLLRIFSKWERRLGQ